MNQQHLTIINRMPIEIEIDNKKNPVKLTLQKYDVVKNCIKSDVVLFFVD